MKNQLNKITYLFGAGASANALPTVKPNWINLGYTDSLRELGKLLRLDDSIHSGYKSFVGNFCNDLEWIATNGDEHGTVDTFAKFCSLKDLKGLERLKFTLSLFFTIKQFIEKKLDKRYLNFITRNIDSRHLFPENIKILNWNYDFQVQLSAQSFRQERFHYDIDGSVRTPPLIDYYPMVGSEFMNNAHRDHFELSMVHLNGIAGFYYYVANGYILNYYLNNSLRDINHLIEAVLSDRERKHSLLTFAFERNTASGNYLRNRFSNAKKMIENTTILVIIGYSFPPENVEIDAEIFEVLKIGHLKRIYYQDPFNSGEFLRELFNLEDISIENCKECDNFHIPREIRMQQIEIV